jgi:hypothetical protein
MRRVLCASTVPRFALVFLGLLPAPAFTQCDAPFLRGDTNGDRDVDISDPIKTLGILFLGDPPVGCFDAADANDSNVVDLSDAVHTFNFLFQGGEEPAAPGRLECGADPTADGLRCGFHPACGEEPPPEVCRNGADDDCDGLTDEDCPCLTGETRPCGTTDVGECALGIETCTDGVWGACTGNVEPVPETCDLLDNDCSGSADDVPDADADGFTVCTGDCDDALASVNPGAVFDPLDGLDNDCDEVKDEGPFTTSHERDIQPIWDRNCTNTFCHDARGSSEGLSLIKGVAYGQIVNETSGQALGLDLIEPLDPARSYLLHKLENTQLTAGGSGFSMPRGRTLLPLETRQLVARWILEGAPP